MNDLLQTMAVAGGPGAQWAGSIENLDGAEAGDAGMTGSNRRGGQRMKELAFSTNAIDCAALTLPSAGHSRAKLRLQVKGQDARFICVGVGKTGILNLFLFFGVLLSTFHRSADSLLL